MKQKSREALVQAALELFAEQGIDAPSLDAICDRAGYTRGVFYVHFEDREQLLVAVMEKLGAAYLASVFQELEGAGDAPRAGHRFAHAADRFVASVRRGEYPLMSVSKAPLVRMHQLLAACARSDLVRTRYRELVQFAILGAAGLVDEDQKSGGIRADVGSDAIAVMSLAVILGVQTMIELGMPVDPDVLTKTMLRLVEVKTRGARASR
ncbi:MAG TPA: TetR/AcrR family transcriptional regulator [Labilithrix sp.]